MEWIHTPESPLILWVSGRLSGMFPEKCRPTDIYGPCDPQAPRTSYAGAPSQSLLAVAPGDPRVLPIFWWRRHGRCINNGLTRAVIDRTEPACSLVPLGLGPRSRLIRDRPCAVSALSRNRSGSALNRFGPL